MIHTFTLAALAVAALVGSAAAQPYRGGGRAVLYEGPNFEGPSVTITQSTPDLGDWRFNDRARSARFEGRWRVCEHGDFKGRCQEIEGPVADLTTYGLFGQISSLAPAGRYDGYPGGGRPGPRPGRGERGVEGERTVFFPRPSVDGYDLAAGGRGADTFCRSQGLGGAAWFDSSQRAAQALGPDGEIVFRTPVLRDLLCRKY